MIGDGMGLAQIQAAMTANDNYLNLERFPIVGLAKTSASDDYITDSAAGATAMAAGVKTYNGAIGVDARGKKVTSILELAEKRGLSTGLIATSTITHATPAAFIAHNKSRDNHEAIALDFLSEDIEVFIGGGRQYFNQRRDKKDLLQKFTQKGYMVTDSLACINDELPDKLVALLAEVDLPRYSDGRADMLSESTMMATTILNRNPQGFFLMVEGSQIDWGGHDNEIDYVLEEMLDFDQVIGQVLDFAIADKETLVIVTADHETGGLAILGPDFTDEHQVKFSTGSHTSIMVPVFAYGPGAESFSGIYENTEIFFKMTSLLGIE
jgi:alkaline phosphatase